MVSYVVRMERPNTVAGLQAKRAELAKLHKHLTMEARHTLADIDHLDAVIRLFDPEASIEGISIERYEPKHRAPKGHMRRFILGQFREATEPLTIRCLASGWVAEREFPGDHATLRMMRRRISMAIQDIRRDGLIEEAGTDGACKLWKLREGGL